MKLKLCRKFKMSLNKRQPVLLSLSEFVLICQNLQFKKFGGNISNGCSQHLLLEKKKNCEKNHKGRTEEISNEDIS